MVYSNRLDDALAWTSELYRRHGEGASRLSRALGIASLVGDGGGDEDQLVGALLCHTIEDCVDAAPDIRAQIRERFGDRVLQIVEACTVAPRSPRPPWMERGKTYLARLGELDEDSPVMLVSLADEVHAARSILRGLHELESAFWERFEGDHAGTLWLYNTLAGLFEQKRPGHLAAELRVAVERIKIAAGVPEILQVPEASNELLVELIEDRLPPDWSILDALDYLVVEAPGHGDFLAEIEPSTLTVRGRLEILPVEDLPDEAFGTDAAARFETRALETLERLRRKWSELGFEPDAEPSLHSSGSGGFTARGIRCSQLLTRECATLDEVVEALEIVDELGTARRL